MFEVSHFYLPCFELLVESGEFLFSESALMLSAQTRLHLTRKMSSGHSKLIHPKILKLLSRFTRFFSFFTFI